MLQTTSHRSIAVLTQLLIAFAKLSYLSTLDYGTPPPELSSDEIKKNLDKHDILKDLGLTKYPKYMLQVNYEAFHLELGTKVPDHLVIIPPDGINFTHWDYETYYALLLVGLDLPTREKPTKRAYQHWAVGNIPENQFLNGEGLVPYEWTDAPYKKGLHRCVFLLYKQPEEDSHVFDERYMVRSNIELPRTYFNTTFFSTKYRLGDPIAINFFITDIDEDHGSDHGEHAFAEKIKNL